MRYNTLNMDYLEDNFYSPVGSYNLQPEDINPALRNNYRRDVSDYYSEPPASRYKIRNHKARQCNSCRRSGNKKAGFDEAFKENSTLYILIIILVVVTVMQWMIIFFSESNSVTVAVTNSTPPPPPAPSPAPASPAAPVAPAS